MENSILPDDEFVVYILRKTNLNLDDIKKLHISQFADLINELYYQELVDEYYRQYSVAQILAAIYNTIGGRSYSYKDFLSGGKPERSGITEIIEEIDRLAQEKGIILPKE